LRGSIVHEIMSRFAKRFAEKLPGNAGTELRAIADGVMAAYVENPRVAAFWRPRFARFAEWFADTEPARRRGVTRVAAEVEGKLVLAGPAGPFTLSARADRIDECASGLVITDYKTGQLPADTRVVQGLAPQLPLEAAIARGEAGFAHVAKGAVTALRYIRTTGGEPPGEERIVKTDDVAALADTAVERLSRLVADFDDAATPYKALRRARFTYDYDDYAHLARVAEWAADETEDEALS
jgi:ATP-dependent helicase/nuclease subunit B